VSYTTYQAFSALVVDGYTITKAYVAASRVVAASHLPGGKVMKAAIVVNPVGGRGLGMRAAADAQDVLREADWTTEIMPTSKSGDATDLARHAVERGFDVVLACGGDGTFSQVVSGCLDTGVPCGLIPSGTGNDFARSISLPLEPRAAAAALVNGQVQAVDLLDINNGAAWAVNIIGVGFDANVADRINRRIRIFGGRNAYIVAVAQELLRYRPARMSVRVDGHVWEGNALLVAVANTRSYGGGMLIAPDAKIDDGLADIVLIEHMSRTKFVRSFSMLLDGSHLSLPEVHHWQGKEITIESDQPQLGLVDGDVSVQTPLTIHVSPGRALLWMPALH
jgi:diacylglycerol kinase (ATP)